MRTRVALTTSTVALAASAAKAAIFEMEKKGVVVWANPSHYAVVVMDPNAKFNDLASGGFILYEECAGYPESGVNLATAKVAAINAVKQKELDIQANKLGLDISSWEFEGYSFLHGIPVGVNGLITPFNRVIAELISSLCYGFCDSTIALLI